MLRYNFAMNLFSDIRRMFSFLMFWLGFRRKQAKASFHFGTRRPLVSSKPFHLAEHFEPVESSELVEEFFLRFRDEVYSQIDRAKQGSPLKPSPVIRETGRLAEGRRYFFLQHLNESGWLFEQTDFGWQVSRAQKIVSEQTFLRSYEIFDRVTLSRPSSKTVGLGLYDINSSPLRVSSERFLSEYVSLSVYEKQLETLWRSPDTIVSGESFAG